MEGSSDRTADLVNCHFTVNKAALDVAVRPLVAELVLELRLSERLAALEAELRNVQLAVDDKVDSRSLQAANLDIKACTEELQLKASQKAMADATLRIAMLEEVLPRKAENSSLDEVAEEVRKANALVAQKADLSQTSNIVARMNRMQVQSQQQEKLLTQASSALETLESSNLPQNMQRIKEQVSRNTANLRHMQELLPAKASQLSVDDMLAELRDLKGALSLRASVSNLQDISADVCALRVCVEQKADATLVTEVSSKLNSLSQAVEVKVGKLEVQQLSSNMHALDNAVRQKAELHHIMDAKQRILCLESVLEEKALARDVTAMIATVGNLQESMASKAEREVVVNMEEGLCKKLNQLQHVVDRKADLVNLGETNHGLEKLKHDVQAFSDVLAEGQKQMDCCLKLVEELSEGFLLKDTPTAETQSTLASSSSQVHCTDSDTTATTPRNTGGRVASDPRKPMTPMSMSQSMMKSRRA